MNGEPLFFGSVTLSLCQCCQSRLFLTVPLLDHDDDEEDIDEDSPRAIFQRALRVAKSSDTQGYRITTSLGSSSGSSEGSNMRSIQDLTALSWAYFSNELWDQEEILKYRLRALELEDLCDRLKLVLVMMMEHRSNLKKTLQSRDSNEE